MKLYHSWLSSASRRVRLCLAEKQIAYESVPIDMRRQEHHQPAYLAMNPNGVVPALRLDNGESLYESGTICEYSTTSSPTRRCARTTLTSAPSCATSCAGPTTRRCPTC